MKQESLEKFRCPTCRGELEYESLAANAERNTDGVLQGRLACKQCKAIIAIHNGVPRFVPR